MAINPDFRTRLRERSDDESERLSWVLSRNEDQTYALEVRVRHAF